MRISAKLDYAVCAAIGLTAASDEKPICAERLATVRGGPPEYSTYAGAATALPRVWIAVRKNLRSVVEHVTVADVARGQLPKAIDRLAEDPEAWITRQPRRASPPSTFNRKVA